MLSRPTEPAPMTATRPAGAELRTSEARGRTPRSVRRGRRGRGRQPGGNGHTHRCGTVMYSAMPPRVVTPNSVRRAQRFTWPLRHSRHSPHPTSGSTAIGVPIARSTSSPTASTTPDTSCPGTSPSGAGNEPPKKWRSVPQIPTACTRTRTQLAPRFGNCSFDDLERSHAVPHRRAHRYSFPHGRRRGETWRRT